MGGGGKSELSDKWEGGGVWPGEPPSLGRGGWVGVSSRSSCVSGEI